MKRNKTSLNHYLLLIVASVLAVISFFPVFFSLMSAFKTNGEIFRNPIALPTTFRFDNFIYLWQQTRFAEALFHSVFLTVISVAFIIFLIPMGAYAIVRRNSRLSNFIYIYFIAGMMIPFQVYMIPLFRQLKLIGLFGNMAGPIIIYIAGSTSFGTLLYSGFIKSIPREIEEAAAIDGCGAFSTFWKIIFPLLTPCTASLIILQGLGIWNDFLMPMLVLPSNGAKTINVEIFSFVDQFGSRWDVVFAGTVAAMLPVLLVFLFLQRYFVKGITAGTVKG